MARTDEIIAFTTIVRLGTFSAAAKELNITTAGVSRRIKALEERLGTRLLHRTTRSAALTEAGEVYNRRMKELISELERAELEIMNLSSSPAGTLRISAPVAYTEHVLNQHLPAFLEQYPNITLDMSVEGRMVDVVGEGFDVVIRHAPLDKSSLEKIKLTESPLQLVAAPHYLDKHGLPEKIEDLANHNCLRFDATRYKNIWQLERDGEQYNVDLEGNFRTDNSIALYNAVLAGIGIALIPKFLYEKPVGKGKLKLVLPEYVDNSAALWAVYPSAKSVSVKAKAFLVFLQETVGAKA